MPLFSMPLSALVGGALLLAAGLPARAAEDALPPSPALPPPMGRIDIQTQGAGPAEIYVDGERFELLTPTIVTVGTGEHVVILRKDGFTDFEQTVTVEALETVILRAEMVRE